MCIDNNLYNPHPHPHKRLRDEPKGLLHRLLALKVKVVHLWDVAKNAQAE